MDNSLVTILTSLAASILAFDPLAKFLVQNKIVFTQVDSKKISYKKDCSFAVLRKVMTQLRYARSPRHD